MNNERLDWVAREGTAMTDERVPRNLIEAVTAQAALHGSSPALIDAATDGVMSHAELADAVACGAGGWVRTGLRPGDVVGLCAPNSVDFVVATYSVLAAGGVVTTVNPATTPQELGRQMSHSGARWLISTPALAAIALEGIAEAGRDIRLVTFGACEHGQPFDEISAGPAVADLPSPGRDDVAILPYSSGTTGLPKGVVLTHGALLDNLSSTVALQPVTADDVLLAVLPLFHIYGLHVVLDLALFRGASVVIMERYDLAAMLEAIAGWRITRAELVPPIVLALADDPRVDDHDLSSLRWITSAAAPLSGELAGRAGARLGCRIKQAYGMTELSGTSHIAPEGDADKPSSVGVPQPGVTQRVVDPDTGEEVATGERGELLVRTPGMMRGYLKDGSATAATLDADGWLHTGDIVEVDDDGWLFVVDRCKELIKTKGYQVAPAELEACLLDHPDVADAAVIGVPDERAGEVPKAFIVAGSPTLSADAVMEFVAERVAPYKRLRHVEMIDAIPKSASGKILRRHLRDLTSASA